MEPVFCTANTGKEGYVLLLLALYFALIDIYFRYQLEGGRN